MSGQPCIDGTLDHSLEVIVGWWRLVGCSVLRLDHVCKCPLVHAFTSRRELKNIDFRAVVATFEGIQCVRVRQLPEDAPNINSRRRQDIGGSSCPTFGGECESQTMVPEERNPRRRRIDAAVAKSKGRHVAAEGEVEVRHAVRLGGLVSEVSTTRQHRHRTTEMWNHEQRDATYSSRYH